MQALQQARDRATTPAFREVYTQRAGVEGTVAQAVRTCELRQARYLGKKKLHLHALMTAAAVTVLRACAWMAGKIPATTPVSRCQVDGFEPLRGCSLTQQEGFANNILRESYLLSRLFSPKIGVEEKSLLRLRVEICTKL